MYCKRCVIPVEPAGFRDSVTLEPNSYLTINYQEHHVKCVLDYLENSYYSLSGEKS